MDIVLDDGQEAIAVQWQAATEHQARTVCLWQRKEKNEMAITSWPIHYISGGTAEGVELTKEACDRWFQGFKMGYEHHR